MKLKDEVPSFQQIKGEETWQRGVCRIEKNCNVARFFEMHNFVCDLEDDNFNIKTHTHIRIFCFDSKWHL